MSICPHAPQSDRKEDLEFERKKMVVWFNPVQLTRTGIKVLLSELFGSYADKREIQAALYPDQSPGTLFHDYSSNNELWIDYLADTGDGFNSTYTMARLFSRESCRHKFKGSEVTTHRGRLLVLGGDQVYPAASRTEYYNRLVGPFRSALPWVDESKSDAPHLFAIPGNHDWYDGLTSFLRLFCQERWIGGWRTQQRYSYFAIKLSHQWWLWGVDIQLDSDIDQPQLRYFSKIAEAHMNEGDKVILCSATPSWVEDGSRAYRNLVFFEQKTIAPYQGEIKIMLSGDLHHYCRYQSNSEGNPVETRHKIISGGGGAYTAPTHRMPEKLTLSESDGPEQKITVEYQRAGIFPDIQQSRRLRYGVLRFHMLNPWYGGIFAGLYLLYAWLLQSASISLGTISESFVEAVKEYSPLIFPHFGIVYQKYLEVLKYSPATVLLTIFIIGGLIAFSGWRKVLQILAGLIHGLGHITLNIYLIWMFAYLNLKIFFPSLNYNSIWHVLLITGEMFLVGGLLGGFLTGVYLLIVERIPGLHLHVEEVFSAQHIEDYKNFLRLHIDKSGHLTIFPIGVRKVTRKWKFNPQAANGQSWFEEADGETESHLIEEPIVIGSEKMKPQTVAAEDAAIKAAATAK